MKVSTKDMPRDEWLSLRRTGIGGSDAGAILGLNEHRSPADVFFDKITDTAAEPEDNESMRQGRDFENYVAKRFEEETGLKVRKSNFMYRSDEHPFMLADVDRVICGENAGLEIKTCSSFSQDKWADGKIPESYQAQVAHYMAVMDWDYAYIACLILGRDLVIHRIERDEDLIRNITPLEGSFWNDHVLKGILPEADGSKTYDSLLNRYFGETRKETVSLSGFDEDLKRRKELSDLIEKMETERNTIDQKIKLYMAENEYAVADGYKVSWSNVESARLDTKKLKADHPDIYDEYSKVSSSRRFQIREVAA